MIDLTEFTREDLVIAAFAAGSLSGSMMAAMACWFRWKRGCWKRGYLRGCTDSERLFMYRIAQDRRDDTPLPDSPSSMR